MPILLIVYQPRGDFDSRRMRTTMNSLGSLLSVALSAWLIRTNLSPEQVLSRLRPTLSHADNLLVVETTKHYASIMPEGEKDWLYKNMR